MEDCERRLQYPENGGCALGHKYSRKRFTSHKNYYRCMQMAHAINQMAEHGSAITGMPGNDAKLSAKHPRKQLLCWFTFATAGEDEFDENIAPRQIKPR